MRRFDVQDFLHPSTLFLKIYFFYLPSHLRSCRDSSIYAARLLSLLITDLLQQVLGVAEQGYRQKSMTYPFCHPKSHSSKSLILLAIRTHPVPLALIKVFISATYILPLSQHNAQQVPVAHRLT